MTRQTFPALDPVEFSATRDTPFGGYSPEQSNRLARALGAINAALVTFRAGIREETSPIQLWPHHFDLAMLWLPGGKIADQDPDNEEYSDKQMNFGFTFGDADIPEPSSGTADCSKKRTQPSTCWVCGISG